MTKPFKEKLLSTLRLLKHEKLGGWTAFWHRDCYAGFFDYYYDDDARLETNRVLMPAGAAIPPGTRRPIMRTLVKTPHPTEETIAQIVEEYETSTFLGSTFLGKMWWRASRPENMPLLIKLHDIITLRNIAQTVNTQGTLAGIAHYNQTHLPEQTTWWDTVTGGWRMQVRETTEETTKAAYSQLNNSCYFLIADFFQTGTKGKNPVPDWVRTKEQVLETHRALSEHFQEFGVFRPFFAGWETFITKHLIDKADSDSSIKIIRSETIEQTNRTDARIKACLAFIQKIANDPSKSPGAKLKELDRYNPDELSGKSLVEYCQKTLNHAHDLTPENAETLVYFARFLSGKLEPYRAEYRRIKEEQGILHEALSAPEKAFKAFAFRTITPSAQQGLQAAFKQQVEDKIKQSDDYSRLAPATVKVFEGYLNRFQSNTQKIMAWAAQALEGVDVTERGTKDTVLNFFGMSTASPWEQDIKKFFGSLVEPLVLANDAASEIRKAGEALRWRYVCESHKNKDEDALKRALREIEYYKKDCQQNIHQRMDQSALVVLPPVLNHVESLYVVSHPETIRPTIDRLMGQLKQDAASLPRATLEAMFKQICVLSYKWIQAVRWGAIASEISTHETIDQARKAIKEVHVELLKHYHPDRSIREDAEDISKKLNDELDSFNQQAERVFNEIETHIGLYIADSWASAYFEMQKKKQAYHEAEMHSQHQAFVMVKSGEGYDLYYVDIDGGKPRKTVITDKWTKEILAGRYRNQANAFGCTFSWLSRNDINKIQDWLGCQVHKKPEWIKKQPYLPNQGDLDRKQSIEIGGKKWAAEYKGELYRKCKLAQEARRKEMIHDIERMTLHYNDMYNFHSGLLKKMDRETVKEVKEMDELHETLSTRMASIKKEVGEFSADNVLLHNKMEKNLNQEMKNIIKEMRKHINEMQTQQYKEQTRQYKEQKRWWEEEKRRDEAQKQRDEERKQREEAQKQCEEERKQREEERKKQCDEMKKQNDEMDNRIDETDNRIDETDNRIDETDNRIDERQKQLDETDNRIDERQKQLDETDNRIDEHQKQLDEMKDQMAMLMEMLKLQQTQTPTEPTTREGSSSPRSRMQMFS